ncbi:type II secretion system protein N [Sphingosinicella sp. LHD-64]|uniref:type II secretion system protein N n=1 Tax=Sphingosinicella sp. LHD-64 TaxID=3072139 RepID=UPI00280DA9BA|nr:type II secretion system protein N [Sphingosinicella sp. LHD-64]MDQ8755668.1 type II secretion system protein N [Sphingosinicella sp. LHD-64]
MRWQVNPRAERLLARLPRVTVFTALELILLALLAVQAARLVWALVTPVGPIGDWKPPSTLAAAPAAGALGDFDPFFRLTDTAPAVVTGLNLQLFGVREDRATGRGSAIIALPDGSQRSFLVGEEIMPGVTLAEVGFDSVTIDRTGTREQIFLDQSQPVPTGAGGQPTQPAPPPQSNAPVQPVPTVNAAPTASVPLNFDPRVGESGVTGLIVTPGGDGGRAFRAAGLQPGDVIVSVNGQRVVSAEQAQSIIAQSGGNATVMVDRGGRAVPIRMRF